MSDGVFVSLLVIGCCFELYTFTYYFMTLFVFLQLF